MSGAGVLAPLYRGVLVWFLLPFHELFPGVLGHQQIVLFLMDFRLRYLNRLEMAACLSLLNCTLSVV